MTVRGLWWCSCLAACAVSSGCLADRIDDAPAGVFACDGTLDCAEGETCLLGRCYDVEPPRLQIRDPEAFETIEPESDDPPGMISVTVGVGGENLELVEPSSDSDAITEGFVEIVVDGHKVTQLTSGNLFAGTSVTIEVASTPGPHRITAVARRADGAHYDNAGAVASQLVWVDDFRPHVAIVRPWPDTRFAVDEAEVDIEIATLNFTLVPPMATVEGDEGHAHIHYDDTFPACPSDPMCDCCNIEIAAPPIASHRATVTATLPPAGAGPATLTAMLRETTHPPFIHDGHYVYDTIEIVRAADLGPGAE